MLEVIVIFVFDVRQSVWFVLENAIWEILHYFLETPLFSAVLFFAWKERMKERKSTSLFMHSGFSKCTLRSVAPGCYNSFLSSNKAFDRKTIEQFSHTCQEDRFWSTLLANKDLYLISLIFDKCSILKQTIWPWNHTFHTKVYFNEFFANVLRDTLWDKTHQKH